MNNIICRCMGGPFDGDHFRLPLGIVTPHICIDAETKELTPFTKSKKPVVYYYHDLVQDNDWVAIYKARPKGV